MKETHREKIFRAPFIVPSVTACVARAEWYQLSMDNPLLFLVGPKNIIQATVAIFRDVLPKTHRTTVKLCKVSFTISLKLANVKLALHLRLHR